MRLIRALNRCHEIAKLIDPSFTTSLNSSVTDYKYEHGRRYHAYQEGKYVLPNDDAEIQRLGELRLMTAKDLIKLEEC